MKKSYSNRINRYLIVIIVILLIIIAFLIGRSPSLFSNNVERNKQLNIQKQSENDTTNSDTEELKFCKYKIDSCNYFIKTYCTNLSVTPTPIVFDENDNSPTCWEKVQLCLQFISDYCKEAPRIEL